MKTIKTTPSFTPDAEGYYGSGRFGGAYVPDNLRSNLRALDDAFCEAIADPEFVDEYRRMLRDYVGRPSALYRANRLSELYGTNILLKREDLNHTGAHKINNALGLGLLSKRMGKTRIIAETGAGQHGVAAATVAALLGMECKVFMGALDIKRQAPNVERMKMLGAEVVGVERGTATLQDAVDEALATWVKEADESFYLIGSAVGPHPFPKIVSYFQSVISEELLNQLPAQADRELPDAVIACVGGGSNAGGSFYHFADKAGVRLIAAEAAGKGISTNQHAATLSVGHENVLHGSRTKVIDDEPYSISSGLDYPGVGPIMSELASSGRMEVLAVTDTEALEAARRLARLEGIIPALESSHALAVLEKVKFGDDQVVVVVVSGRGDKDMATYLNA